MCVDAKHDVAGAETARWSAARNAIAHACGTAASRPAAPVVVGIEVVAREHHILVIDEVRVLEERRVLDRAPVLLGRAQVRQREDGVVVTRARERCNRRSISRMTASTHRCVPPRSRSRWTGHIRSSAPEPASSSQETADPPPSQRLRSAGTRARPMRRAGSREVMPKPPRASPMRVFRRCRRAVPHGAFSGQHHGCRTFHHQQAARGRPRCPGRRRRGATRVATRAGVLEAGAAGVLADVEGSNTTSGANWGPRRRLLDRVLDSRRSCRSRSPGSSAVGRRAGSRTPAGWRRHGRAWPTRPGRADGRRRTSR